jgi:hypothetical protein
VEQAVVVQEQVSAADWLFNGPFNLGAHLHPFVELTRRDLVPHLLKFPSLHIQFQGANFIFLSIAFPELRGQKVFFFGAFSLTFVTDF